MGHRVPLARNASSTDVVLHRQAMASMARVLNSRGDLAGFRPQYMEYQLVALGHADASLVLPERSKRSIAKAQAKADFLKKLRSGSKSGPRDNRPWAQQ